MNIKTAAWFSVGSIAGAFFGFITLPIMSWFVSQESIGMLVLFQSIITLTVVVVSLGLDQSYVREYHDSANKSELARICFLPSILLTLIVVVGLAIWPNWLLNYFHEGELSKNQKGFFVFLMSLSLMCMVFERYLSVFIRMAENGWAYFISRIVPKVLFLMLVLALGGASEIGDFNHEFAYLLVSQTLAWLIGAGVMAYFLRGMIKEAAALSFPMDGLRPLMAFGLPLVLSGLAFWLFSLTDRLMLAKYASLADLGVYAMAVNIAGIGALLQQVFSTLWHPIIYKKISRNEEDVNVDGAMEMLSVLCYWVICLIAIFAPVLVRFLPIQYGEIKYILAGCMLPPIFILLSEVTGIGISIKKRTILLVFITITALFLNVTLNYFFIRKAGISGAALSSVLSFFTYMALKTEISVACWKDIKRRKFYFVSTMISLVASLQMIYGGAYEIEFIISWVILLLILSLLYRKVVSDLFVRIKEKMA